MVGLLRLSPAGVGLLYDPDRRPNATTVLTNEKTTPCLVMESGTEVRILVPQRFAVFRRTMAPCASILTRYRLRSGSKDAHKPNQRWTTGTHNEDF